MHEMGIANSVLEAVHRELDRYPGRRATKVGLRIGTYAAVDPDALRFCFDALKKATEFELLELQIDWREDTDQLEFAHLELEDACEVTP